MLRNKEENNLQKMLEIADLIEQGREKEGIKVKNIYYFKDFSFEGSGLAEKDIYIAQIENEIEHTNTYEIYSGITNRLIATVDKTGKVHFMPEYIESLKQIDAAYVEMLNLDDLQFVLPQELAKEDKVLTKEERKYIVEKQKAKESKQTGNTAQENEEEQKSSENKENVSSEEQKRKSIAAKTKVPPQNILMIRENSSFYRDHPNLEPNLYFRKDKDGIIRAEYIDQNGNIQLSKYFESSTTATRQETISLGSDGTEVTKQVPYQTMKTKGLNSVDKDIRDIRIIINIDQYGYLDIEEARQGKNGKWLSHDIEVEGRAYNSNAVKEATSIKTRNAEPDKQTETYEKTANTGLAQDGIQYDEMYLIEHAQEVIESFIAEGYQRKEAIQIFNYMIGKEPLSEEEAKQKVEELERTKGNDEERVISEANSEETIEQDLGEERTPWGDAERRERR